MVRQDRARATRRALLVTAGERFAVDGYHATSLSDLLRSEAVTKGAFYFHFPSKESLAEELVAAISESWDLVVPAVRAHAADALEALVLLCDVVIVRLDDPVVRGAARVLRDQVVRSPTLVEISTGWETENEALLAAAAEQGLLRRGVDVGWTAHEIVMSLAGRRTLLDSLGSPEALWANMNDFWAGLLPLVAVESWCAHWNARPWRRRTPPCGVGPYDGGRVRLSDLDAPGPAPLPG